MEYLDAQCDPGGKVNNCTVQEVKCKELLDLTNYSLVVQYAKNRHLTLQHIEGQLKACEKELEISLHNDLAPSMTARREPYGLICGEKLFQY